MKRTHVILAWIAALMFAAAGFLVIYLGVWGFISGCDLDAGKLALRLLGGFVLGYAAVEIGVRLKRGR